MKWVTKNYGGDVSQVKQNLDYTSVGDFFVVDTSSMLEKKSGLLDYGFLYIPKTCRYKQDCGLNIYFHGATLTAKDFGSKVVRQTGLLEYAASSNLIVFFP